MKLAFQNVQLVSGDIAGKKFSLVAKFRAAFGPVIAEALGCKDDLFQDGTASLRPFKFHGLRLLLPDASVDFTLPAEEADKKAKKKGKSFRFRGTVSDFEITQQKTDIGIIDFKIKFDGADQKLKIYSMLFVAETGPEELPELLVEGAQKELFGEPEGDDADA